MNHLPFISLKNKLHGNFVIVVLTGDHGRIAEGLSLLKKNPDSLLFISGVNVRVSIFHLLLMHGNINLMLTKRIQLGYTASNTKQNAMEIKSWLDSMPFINTIALVTSRYHMLRSLLNFHLIMPDKCFVPIIVADRPEGNNRIIRFLKEIRFSFFEYNKILIMLITGEL